ncbi:MAG: FecR domain-containing protein [Nitrospiraceae bacterium]|nr:MAG: FecR domain-containing protein [Nitrospiraceae bacterium]
MNRAPLISILCILLFLPSFAYSSDLGTMRTSLVEGDVQMQPYDLSEYIPVSINMPLRDGDQLWVPRSGKLEIQMIDGSYVRLDEATSLIIERAGHETSLFYLKDGQAYINFSGRDRNTLTINTPVTSLTAYKRVIFTIRVDEYERLNVSVIKGTLHADSSFNISTIRAGKTLYVSRDGYAELRPIDRPDYWEQWNRDRDYWLREKRYSSRYLPDELHVYAHDFDEHGTWVHAHDYGYVWKPRIRLSAGWSPYRLGRWAWRGGDYVWISYEPWGWAPYHYGRWAFSVSIGWYWVPPARGNVYWGPGYVSWGYTPSYVAWVPLAPREVYYGYGHYGPFSVNINITKHKRFPRHRYKNAYVKNSITVVHHDTFIEGKYKPYRPRKNPFLHEKIHIGRPKIKPGRTAYMPLIRSIESSKRPPERIRKSGVRLESRKHFYKRDQKDSRYYNRPKRKLTPIKKEYHSTEKRSGQKQYRGLKPYRPSQDSIKRKGPMRRTPGSNIYRNRSHNIVINEDSVGNSRNDVRVKPFSFSGKQQLRNRDSFKRTGTISQQKPSSRKELSTHGNGFQRAGKKNVRQGDRKERRAYNAVEREKRSASISSPKSTARGLRPSSFTSVNNRSKTNQQSLKRHAPSFKQNTRKGISAQTVQGKRPIGVQQGNRSRSLKNFGFKKGIMSGR